MNASSTRCAKDHRLKTWVRRFIFSQEMKDFFAVDVKSASHEKCSDRINVWQAFMKNLEQPKLVLNILTNTDKSVCLQNRRQNVLKRVALWLCKCAWYSETLNHICNSAFAHCDSHCGKINYNLSNVSRKHPQWPRNMQLNMFERA